MAGASVGANGPTRNAGASVLPVLPSPVSGAGAFEVPSLLTGAAVVEPPAPSFAGANVALLGASSIAGFWAGAALLTTGLRVSLSPGTGESGEAVPSAFGVL